MSLAQLIDRRKTDLAECVLARRRVYLDTRFWVFLRDAYLDRPKRPVHSELLNALRSGVAAGTLLCPINDSTLFELTRQGDTALLMASARLMDELSLGIVIQNTVERVHTEVRHFITECAKHQRVPAPRIGKVWLKVGHVVGTPYTTTGVLDPAEELVVQKAFADVLWSITLEEMLSDTQSPPDRRPDQKALAARLTGESKQHEGDMKSFIAVYEAELAGFWDAHEQIVTATVGGLFAEMFPGEHDITVEQKAEQTRVFKNALRNAVRFDKAEASLPTSQVISGLHAIVRWNKNRGFRPTDFYDFDHAAAALPYCDVFLTEKFLATMLNRPPLSFGERFGTVVENDAQAALAVIAA